MNGRLNSNGGAINWIGSNGILSNCTFENCSANNGGAVYWNSNDGQILNSKFINSRAKSGGAVYVSGNNEVVAASSIFKNNAEILNAPAYGSKLSNCIFEDCSADNGGSVYWNAKNGEINLSGIQIDPKTTIKRVMVVTGERQAYLEGRAETTTIVRA